MDSRKIGTLAGIVGVLGVAVQYVPAVVISRWIDGGFEGALPMVGTPGQTVTAYSYVVGTVEVVVTIGLALALGSYVAGRVDISTDYPRVARAVAAGVTVGVILGSLPLAIGGLAASSIDAITIFLLIPGFIRMFVDVALLVFVGAIAGAAIAYVRGDGPGPPRSSDAPAGSGEDTAAASSDDGGFDWRPIR